MDITAESLFSTMEDLNAGFKAIPQAKRLTKMSVQKNARLNAQTNEIVNIYTVMVVTKVDGQSPSPEPAKPVTNPKK